MGRVRIAAVSFVNTKPLIYGLEDDGQVELYLDVPSRLRSGLEAGHFDVALLPVADVARIEGARILGTNGEGGWWGAGICCEDETLTVRIFSDRPLGEITTLACDTDSHTSVELARVILRERYGANVTLVPLERGKAADGPMLLIGDKVITSAPPAERFRFQADLGHEWRELTGYPFVFAAWTARPGYVAGYEAGGVVPLLRGALEGGVGRIPEIARRYGPARGWPVEVAEKYLSSYLHYRLTARHHAAIALFWAKAGLGD